MRVIAKRTLWEFWDSTPKYADAEDPLKSWYREAKQPIYLTPADVKAQYRTATVLQNNRTVFNIAGNKYRLVVDIDYTAQMMFICFIGTHPDYDSITSGRLRQRSEADLIPLIGSESLVAEVMSKHQPLTPEMIRALHIHLGMPADVLLQ